MSEIPAERIRRTIRTYHDEGRSEHHRYRSWEHCYEFFSRARGERRRVDRDEAAIRLGFYLASWGMYRGSGFLLQHAYTVHRPVVDLVLDQRFHALSDPGLGSRNSDSTLIPLMLDLADMIRRAYEPHALDRGYRRPTDTLVSKVLLGTYGCVPACDTYFRAGFKQHGLHASGFSTGLIEEAFDFCHSHVVAFRAEQARIQKTVAVTYPLMKLVDMYFWQRGYELESAQG